MNTITQALTAQGIDPADVTLVGTMRHLNAGDRDHYDGKPVQVFKPVIVQLQFEHQGQFLPALAMRNEAQSKADEKAFWASMQLPAGVDAEEAQKLAEGLIEKHRDLTGQIHATYEKIEREPREIANILAASKELRIGYTVLRDYLARDLEIFDAIFESMINEEKIDPDRKDMIVYQRDSLLNDFVRWPCDFELHRSLRKEFSDGGWMVGMQFANYYTWFRESEQFFGSVDNLPADTRATMKMAMTAWSAAGSYMDTVEEKAHLFNRNFKVHPRHEEQVLGQLKQIQDEIDGEKKPSAMPSP